MKTRNASREFPGPNGKPLLVEIITAEAAIVVREKHERDGCKFTVAQLWGMAQKLKKGSLELTEPVTEKNWHAPREVPIPPGAAVTEARPELRDSRGFRIPEPFFTKAARFLNPFRK